MIEDFLQSFTADLSKRKKGWKYYDDTHKQISELEEQVSYHADFGKFPDDLFKEACPNQTPEEFEYNKKTYRQKTKAAWDKAVAATFRIWNPQNYSIFYGDEKQKEYFTYLYPIYGDFEEWYKDNVHPDKLSDPNAVVAVYPQIPMIEVEGELKVDQTKEISPVCKVFDAEKVWIFNNEFTLLETEERSEVTDGGKLKRTGLIFLYYDKENIYYVEQFGKKEEYKFQYYLYFNHAWGYVPAFKLKGVPDDEIFHSYFMGAVPFLEDAILTDANFRAVKHRMAYPNRWYYTDSCNECNGNKFIEDYATGEKHTCHVCKGTGKRMTFSPFRDYEIPLPPNGVSGTDTTQLPTPPFGTETVDSAIFEFLKKDVRELTEDGFAAVNIDITNKVNGQTATESKIDREEFFSLLKKISDELFYLLQDLIDAIGWMRWGVTYDNNRTIVNPPSEYTIRSAESLTEEFKTATDARLPSPYKKKVLMENIKIRFSSDEKLMRVMDLVSKIDSFIDIDDNTLNLKKSNGLIALWECVLHDRIYTFINDKFNDDPEFLIKDFDVIKKELEDMAKAKALELTPNNRSADAILGNITKNAATN